MFQNLADGRWGVDEGDDLQPAAAVRTDQRVDLVYFLNQPGPGPAASAMIPKN